MQDFGLKLKSWCNLNQNKVAQHLFDANFQTPVQIILRPTNKLLFEQARS